LLFPRFFGAFLRLRRKNRAIRGSAIAPAPARRAVAAPHPSYPLRGQKNGIHAVFLPFGVFAAQKLQEKVTADILSAIHADFRLAGFSLRENPRNWLQPTSMSA
jgi:hypothetical protein